MKSEKETKPDVVSHRTEVSFKTDKIFLDCHTRKAEYLHIPTPTKSQLKAKFIKQ